MADKMALMLEAERRGILPPDKLELLAEARRRGLVPGPQPAPTAAAPFPSGPLAGPKFAMDDAPSIEQTNAQNLTARNDPAFRQKQAQAEEQNRQGAFRAAPLPLRVAAGAGGAVAGVGRGILQLAGSGLDSVIPGDTNYRAQADAGEVAARERDQFMAGDTAATVGKFGGEAALWTVPFLRAGKLPTVASRVGAGVGIGAGAGALTPTVEGESRALNTVIGGGLGAGGQLAGEGLGLLANKAAGAIPRQAKELFDAARARGITLTPAQLTDNKLLRYFNDRMRMYPGSGAAGKSQAQVDAWNTNLAKTVGADSDRLTPDVFADAKSKISGAFEGLTERNNLAIDDGLRGELGDIVREAESFGDSSTISAVKNMIARIESQANGSSLPGRAYQAIDSQIGKIGKAGGEKALYLGRIRDALRTKMDDSISPDDQAAWQQARAQWKALKTVEPLVAKSDDGVLSPASLMGRVTANNAGKSSMATGRAGELGSLARIGQRIKPPPTSGTSERLLGDSIMNPLNWPALGVRTALGATVGRIPQSGLLSRALVADAPAKGLLALQRAVPGLTAASVPAVTSVTQKRRKRLRKKQD